MTNATPSQRRAQSYCLTVCSTVGRLAGRKRRTAKSVFSLSTNSLTDPLRISKRGPLFIYPAPDSIKRERATFPNRGKHLVHAGKTPRGAFNPVWVLNFWEASPRRAVASGRPSLRLKRCLRRSQFATRKPRGGRRASPSSRAGKSHHRFYPDLPRQLDGAGRQCGAMLPALAGAAGRRSRQQGRQGRRQR